MLLYVAGHTSPGITYRIKKCAARYEFCLMLVHKHAIKKIGHYLKAIAG
ncbi:hypothetical protein ACHAXS_013604 [Conticribra weissflogii]